MTVQKSRFELESLEPRILLSGEGVAAEVPCSSTGQIIKQDVGNNEILNNSTDLIYQPQAMILPEQC